MICAHCSASLSNCLECDSASNCINCDASYYFLEDLNTGDFTCINSCPSSLINILIF